MNMSNKTEVDKIINHLEGIDGETMEYIVKKLCMVEQLFKQTILTMSDAELNRMLDERKTAENSKGDIDFKGAEEWSHLVSEYSKLPSISVITSSINIISTQLGAITDENYNLKAELGRTSEELHTLEKAKGGLGETPLAYLTTENCLWMQDPEDENIYTDPLYQQSYHDSYCIERGYIPIYDPNLIEHFSKHRMLDERKTENSCGSDTPYHFISSHGDLFIDKFGNVLPQSDLSDWLLEIGKVDVEELIHYLQLNGFDGLVDGDVLDFGYWDKNGEYHKPDITWRRDTFHNQDFRYTQIEEVITKNEQWLNKYRTV